MLVEFLPERMRCPFDRFRPRNKKLFTENPITAIIAAPTTPSNAHIHHSMPGAYKSTAEGGVGVNRGQTAGVVWWPADCGTGIECALHGR